MKKLFIYSDASFSLLQGIAVSGFLLCLNQEENTDPVANKILVRTTSFAEKNNIRAEIVGVCNCLQEILKLGLQDVEINLYTDCQTVSNLLRRRKKLESNSFKNKSGIQLANADLYQIFYQLYDHVNPKITWVKGHTKSDSQTLMQRNFQFVDRAVRSELRKLIN